jgi:mono/diheme cytochrome c family protein
MRFSLLAGERRHLLAVSAALALLAAGSGCGGGSGGDAATSQPAPTTQAAAPPAKTTAEDTHALARQGKQVFAANCGGCHTLAAAHTSGTVGPNLDRLKPSQLVVESQVSGGGASMPAFKGRLTTAQITAVATYVSGAAG